MAYYKTIMCVNNRKEGIVPDNKVRLRVQQISKDLQSRRKILHPTVKKV